MCLILFSWQQRADYPLILAANRDERYERPTQGLHRWQQPPRIIGGRDLEAGGSWLASNRYGQFAAVTNVRDHALVRKDARSRGGLITDYLTSDLPLDDWLEQLRRSREQYSGFNLLLGNLGDERLVCYSNQSDQLDELTAGLYGLSNGSLDEPWPKVERGKQLLNLAIAADDKPDMNRLLTLLADDQQPGETQLPDTGIGIAAERILAPITIRSERYGTCSSSVLLAHSDGQVQMHELDRRPHSSTSLLSESWTTEIF